MTAPFAATGLTHAALARWLRINRSTVHRWAKGTHRPTHGEAMAMDMLARGDLPERFRPHDDRDIAHSETSR
jgi:hypothetical protein